MARTNYDLGSEFEALLADFCVASDDTPKVRVLRKAIKFYIDHRRGSEPLLAKRMDEARKNRVATRREKIALITGTGE